MTLACAEPESAGLAGTGSPGAGGNSAAAGAGFESGAGGEGGTRSRSGACELVSCEGTRCDPLAGRGECSSPFLLLGPGSTRTGWASRRVNADFSCAESFACSDCEADGALAFELDLTDAEVPVDLRVELDANFDGSLRLERGDCADAVVEASNGDHVEGVQRAVLTTRVEPERYRVIVTAEESPAASEFQLDVGVRALGAQCLTTPSNDTCADAVALDPSLAVQTVIGSTRCGFNDAFSLFECHLYDDGPEVFYRLDLSDRDRPVVLRATTNLTPTNFDTTLYVLASSRGRCTDHVTCNDNRSALDEGVPGSSELVSELGPGEYFLVVDSSDDDAGDFGLRVSLDEVACAPNLACTDALPLDPAPGEQTVTVSFACARSSLLTSCSTWEVTPDVYYRLDLSGYDEPVRVRLEGQDSNHSYYFALLRGDEDECGTELRCNDGSADHLLAPGLYFLAVSQPLGAPWQTDVKVTIEPVDSDELAPCIDAEVMACAASCCYEEARSCVFRFAACGLDPRLEDCVCDAAPECCEVSGFARECLPVLAACELFCPDFDHVSACEEQGF